MPLLPRNGRAPVPRLWSQMLGAAFVMRVLRIVAGVVLLILAPSLDSPLYPGQKETTPSETCPHPWRFEAWIGTFSGVLFLFTVAGVWKGYRRRKLRDAVNDVFQHDVEAPLPPVPPARRQPTPAAAAPAAPAPEHIPRAQSTPNLATVAPAAQLRQTHSQTTLALNRAGTQSSSSATAMTSPLTLVASSSKLIKSTPTTPITPVCPPSTASSSTSTPAASVRTPSLRTHSMRAPSTTTIPEHERAPPLPTANGISPDQRPIATPEPVALRPARGAGTPRNQSTASLGTTHAVQGSEPEAHTALSEKQEKRAKLHRALDTMADLVDVLWMVRFVLFCLGHFILFLPFPNKHTTCYHSAPLLWWGLFVGLIYDWLRLAFMAIVCIIVIGIAIREIVAGLWMRFAVKMGWREPPPPPAPPTPAPSPLTTAELLRCKIVCYVPDPDDPVSDDGHSVMEGDAVVPSEIDASRLPFTALVLPSHRATCGVCQENFRPPREVARIMYKVDELRQLPCEHIFHQVCVDEWLTKHSDACPYCTQSVREGLKKIEAIRSASASRVSVNRSAAASRNASRTSLPMTSTSRNASRVSFGPSAAMSHNSLPSSSRNASHVSLQHMPTFPYGSGSSSSPGTFGPASASRTSLSNGGYVSASASRTSLHHGGSASASASRTSLAYYPAASASASRTSLAYYPAASASASRTSLAHIPAASQSLLGLPSAAASRTSLATQSEESHSPQANTSPYNVPTSTSRSPVAMNPAAGSRISLTYVHPATSSRTSLSLPPSPGPSPSATPAPPVVPSRQSVQYPPTTRISLSATASRTSLVPVPEGEVTKDTDVPPVPPVPGAIGQAL